MSMLDFLAANEWAMEVTHFDRMHAIIQRHADGIRLSASEIEAAIGRAPETPHPRDRKYEVSNGVALVPVRGVLAKHADQVGGVSQPRGTSFENVQRDLRSAMSDPEVRAILLHIESPGGSVDGTQATADMVAAAAAQKRTVAYIDGLGASAAYWLACMADKVYANETAIVGSIGAITALVDAKGAAEKQGIKVRVLRSGSLKGGVLPGEAASDEMVASHQRIIDDLGALFANAVGEARGLEGDDLKAITDGATHVAARAKDLGLIDGIRSFDDVLAELGRTTPPTGRPLAASLSIPSAGARPAATGPQPMKIEAVRLAGLIAEHPSHAVMISRMAAGDPASKAEPATEQEINAAIQQAQAKSLTEQIATMSKSAEDAKTAHAAAIAAKDTEITALKAELKEAKEAAAIAKPKGVTALEGSNIPDPKTVDAKSAYDAKVAELKKAGDKTPSATIARNHPDLQAAYIAACNAQPSAAKEGAK